MEIKFHGFTIFQVLAPTILELFDELINDIYIYVEVLLPTHANFVHWNSWQLSTLYTNCIVDIISLHQIPYNQLFCKFKITHDCYNCKRI